MRFFIVRHRDAREYPPPPYTSIFFALLPRAWLFNPRAYLESDVIIDTRNNFITQFIGGVKVFNYHRMKEREI